MAIGAFRWTADANGGRGSRIQPQLFDRGSLMLILLAEAIMRLARQQSAAVWGGKDIN